MLKQRKPMKRGTGFKRPEWVPAARSKAEPLKRPPVMALCMAPAKPVPKEPEPIRSEEYRRLTAARPCSACRIQGYSQAAHLPPVAKGVKQSDLMLFPLCCARTGVPGCHADFDQYRMFPRAVAMEVGRGWATDNARAIFASGKWPANVPVPEFLTNGDIK